MRPIVKSCSYGRVEIENVFPEDVGKPYFVLHFCGPQIGFRDPGVSRGWRVEWDGKLPPMLHMRGILFGVHFLVEGVIVK